MKMKVKEHPCTCTHNAHTCIFEQSQARKLSDLVILSNPKN